MVKIIYGGWEPKTHAQPTSFGVAKMEYTEENITADSLKFLENHPEFFEYAIEVDGRRWLLPDGMRAKFANIDDFT